MNDYYINSEKYRNGQMTDAESKLHEAACDFSYQYSTFLREQDRCAGKRVRRIGSLMEHFDAAYSGFLKGVEFANDLQK